MTVTHLRPTRLISQKNHPNLSQIQRINRASTYARRLVQDCSAPVQLDKGIDSRPNQLGLLLAFFLISSSNFQLDEKYSSIDVRRSHTGDIKQETAVHVLMPSRLAEEAPPQFEVSSYLAYQPTNNIFLSHKISQQYFQS